MASVRTRAERVREAAALALVGGYVDAYSFLAHGGVFANAQTGNVVLGAVDAASGQWAAAWRHVPPILAFAVGVVTVEVLARHRGWRWNRRPTRVVLLVEAAVFVVVGALPAGAPNAVSTVLVAWAATLQVQTFRQVGAVSYNTTFTTGNLRALLTEGSAWSMDRDAGARRRFTTLGAVVVAFALGAVLGGLGTRGAHTHAILLVVPVLLLVLGSIVVSTRRLPPAGSDGGAVGPEELP